MAKRGGKREALLLYVTTHSDKGMTHRVQKFTKFDARAPSPILSGTVCTIRYEMLF